MRFQEARWGPTEALWSSRGWLFDHVPGSGLMCTRVSSGGLDPTASSSSSSPAAVLPHLAFTPVIAPSYLSSNVPLTGSLGSTTASVPDLHTSSLESSPLPSAVRHDLDDPDGDSFAVSQSQSSTADASVVAPAVTLTADSAVMEDYLDTLPMDIVADLPNGTLRLSNCSYQGGVRPRRGGRA